MMDEGEKSPSADGNVREKSHVASELSLILIVTRASSIVCGPPAERKKGGRTGDRQRAKHLQRIRDPFWNLKCPSF